MNPKKTREEVVVAALNAPKGSHFKGYQEYNIQELEIIPKEMIYRLAVWQAPDGSVIFAVLPQNK